MYPLRPVPLAPILLVEDKDSLRAMLRHALEQQGHSVVEAVDEAEALRLVRERVRTWCCLTFAWSVATASAS